MTFEQYITIAEQFVFIASKNKYRVTFINWFCSKLSDSIQKVDFKHLGLNQSRSFLGTGQANQV